MQRLPPRARRAAAPIFLVHILRENYLAFSQPFGYCLIASFDQLANDTSETSHCRWHFGPVDPSVCILFLLFFLRAKLIENRQPPGFPAPFCSRVSFNLRLPVAFQFLGSHKRRSKRRAGPHHQIMRPLHRLDS